jgi:hypothetical protein
MVLHFVVPQFVFVAFLLQPTFVTEMPDSFDVLQPARTFSSGVPLPRTINWGRIHSLPWSSMLSLPHPHRNHPYLYKETFMYLKSFLLGVN